MSKSDPDVDQRPHGAEQSAEPQRPGSSRQPDPAQVENPYLRLMAENRLQRPAEPAAGQSGGPDGPPQPTFGRPPTSQATPPRTPKPPHSGGAQSTDPSPGRRRRRPLLIIGVAVIALALVATAAIAVINRVRAGERAATADVASIVRDYFTALADGDAERAIGYLADKPEDTSMMTAEVLQASNKVAPISEIAVSEPTDPQARSVSASYQVGDTQVQTMINVRPVNDSIMIERGFFTLDVSTLPTKLPLTLNGTKIDQDKLSLFPGSYQLRTPVSGIGLGDGATFTIASGQDTPVISVRPKLTDDGRTTFQEKISAAVADCVDSTKIKAGCGLTVEKKLSGDRTVQEGSVQRKLTAATEDSLKNLTPVLDPDDPTLVRPAALHPAVQTTGTCEVPRKKKPNKTKTESCDLDGAGTSLGTPVLDLTKSKDPVSWS